MTQGGKMEKEFRQAIYAKYNGHCAYCGAKITYGQMQADHIHPRSRGGEWTYENFNPSCSSCNHFKGAYTVEELREEIKAQVFRLRRDRATFRLAERFGLIEVGEEKEVIFYFETVEPNAYNPPEPEY